MPLIIFCAEYWLILVKNSSKMKKSKHCSIEQRKIIKKIAQRREMCAFIREQLGISNVTITNARNWSLKIESRGRRRKTNKRQDNATTRIVKKHPSITSLQIRNELNLPIATTTIRKRFIAVSTEEVFIISPIPFHLYSIMTTPTC